MASPRSYLRSSNSRRHVLELVLAVIGLQLLGTAFVSTSTQTSSKGNLGSRLRNKGVSALRAEGEGEEKPGDGGFLKFLKVEQDIELSPEEYQMALDQEVEAQRKKYYIGGVVKKQNLVVPWKPVDEKQLTKDAKRQLRKNGIQDPAGESDEDVEDSAVDITRVGDDVRLDWAGGSPGTKVGYIIERKPDGKQNYVEIATYDNMQNPQLLVKQYSGHEFTYVDELPPPGKYTYRVLCRYRSGEITVVDEKELLMVESGGLDFKLAFGVLGALVVFSGILGFGMDPGVQP